MPLNKLDNFIKNTEGRILYVNPYDIDSTDAISNQGNSLASPFKTIQRALLEAARFSYVRGSNNDIVEKTTILLYPGVHTIDNRPGFAIKDVSGTAKAVAPAGTETLAQETLTLSGDSIFDLTQEENILYKFNSIHGGVIVPRGTSIVGMDLRKTKIRAKYVPNPTDPNVDNSAIFRITGACYFWQMSFFDGDESGLVYTDPADFSELNRSIPLFSHHKLTVFEYADGVNKPAGYDITDLDMYYSKLSNAFNLSSDRDIDQKYPADPLGFVSMRPEYEIVGAFGTDPINISEIISGDGITPSTIVRVTTAGPHNLTTDTPVKINGLAVEDYNVSTKVQNVISSTEFTYLLPTIRVNLPANPSSNNGTVTIETDTVSGASPYIFNCSLRSVYGMQGILGDGRKATGFRSIVLAQYTGISLQKDDRAFVKYNESSRSYEGIFISKVTGAELPLGASSTNPDTAYHLDSDARYRKGWETSHVKVENDAFMQIVSVFGVGFSAHFVADTGGDQSITNSNSNFGQSSLKAEGFKKNAFAKDDSAYITSIVAPRSIDSEEENIEWLSLDVAKTISVGKSNQLYLFGLTEEDDIPPSLTQGYRIGASVNDKLYVNIAGVGTYSADIYMTDTFDGETSTGTTSSKKEFEVNGISNSIITLNTLHTFKTGEKVRLLSSDGDYPENTDEKTTYYVIANDVDAALDTDEIKIAISENNAVLDDELSIYGGSNVSVYSMISDKNSGDIGSPVQYDTTNNNWFIHTEASSDLYNAIVSNGVSGIGARTEVSFVKRTPDNRSLDEKIYKLRVVVPKEVTNSRDPVEGFVMQESSTTGFRNDLDDGLTSITIDDHAYNRNPRFISTCSTLTNTVTVISELPHDLSVGENIIIKNVSSDSNTAATDDVGFNGTFEVASVVDELTFTYSTTDVNGVVHTTGSFTNDTSSRTTSLPRFERNDLKSNYYVYRNEVITPYVEGIQDGVYYIYALNASNTVAEEFTDKKYSQNVSDLYPQLDRDNNEDNAPSAKSYARRSPLGRVTTNDLKSSITRETADSILQDFGKGFTVDAVANTTDTATITFDGAHGLSGITTYSTLTGGTGHTNGTYYNVKLYNNSVLSSWDGATAKVVVSGGSVSGLDIQAHGSGYTDGETLYIDTEQIGGTADASITLATSGISTNIGDVIQFTGDGTTSDQYYRITSIPSKVQVAVARTAGDISVTTNQYGLVIGPSVEVSSSSYNSTTGILTVNCTGPHGLLAGNKFKIVDSSNNNLGDYLVDSKTGVDSFTAITNKDVSPKYVFKHGFSSNNAVADSSVENIGVRDVFFYDNEVLEVVSFTSDTQIRISSPVSGISTTKRFPMGSYIQVDSEIMRITSSTLSGSGNDEISVIRGSMGTTKATHRNGSLIRKIDLIPVEFRRPSILRASGHTFEYLGYGPGNYSTGLPQVQVKTLTEEEEFLVQAQELSCGSILYSGMSSRGDFFLGNKKSNSTTGKEVTFKIPIPTITGQDPSRLSVVFDEVIVKERLLVEGGNSGTVLSEFDGPVTFNNNVRYKGETTFANKVRITSPADDALDVSGGITVGNLTAADANVKDLNVSGNIDANGVSEFGNVRISGETIDTTSGDLTLDAASGQEVVVNSNATFNGDVTVFNTLNSNSIAPIGSVVMWSGATNSIPAGWLLCNGAAVSRSTFSVLFGVTGTTFGSGNGSTTFNLPNLQDRFALGGGDSYSRGETGGSKDAIVVSHVHDGTTGDNNRGHTHDGTTNNNDKDHTHEGTTSNSGAHDHGIDDPGHSHEFTAAIHSGDTESGDGDNEASNRGLDTENATTGISVNSSGSKHSHAFDTDKQSTNHKHTFETDGISQNHKHVFETDTAGSSGTDKNMPPYIVLGYIIRYE